jgi:hypothetical protein
MTTDNPPDKPTEEEIQQEHRKIRKVRILFDVTRTLLLTMPDLTPGEAVHMIQQVRNEILTIFPGKESVYELIYAPKFDRIVRERFGEEAARLLSGEIQ